MARVSFALVITIILAAGLSAQEASTPPIPPPVPLARAPGPITIDGDLTDPGWEGATVIDTFFETVFADNRAPLVKTVAWLTRDDRYLYIGLRCDDPEPNKIRAPYADRDNVIGTDDNVAVFLDTRGDRRSAQEFRVSPRGIQGDAMFNDANGNEDFSPDFFYDTAAKITDTGWQAEMRIPLSSLRYPKADPQNWGILIWRNYPRAFRYAIYSSPQPRGANCVICNSRELTGITGLPSPNHFVLAPYVSVQDVAQAPSPGEALVGQPTQKNVGFDLKWNPNASTAIDGTVNPDFSQVESDIAQIAVNNRFALFYPEKRPFFLEGIDLFDTPIQAVYTRTITSPRWGIRATGKFGASSYTMLLTEDRGGGSVVIPGSLSSDLAPQDFRSVVGIGRLRRDFGQSFVGLLFTGREVEGGGHNNVFGPDFQWRPSQRDRVYGQLLVSQTQTPDRPDLTPVWTGSSSTSHGIFAAWNHTTPTLGWSARYRDFGDGFRADVGFVPQVGYRDGQATFGYTFFPSGFFNFVNPLFVISAGEDRSGRTIQEHMNPGIFVLGRHNLNAEIDLNLDRALTVQPLLPAQQLLSTTAVGYTFQIDPSRRFSRIGANGFFGEAVDLVNVRVGTGGTVNGFATLRPTDHLALDLNSDFSWLNVDSFGESKRLFSAAIQRLKLTYNFSSRLFVRLIGQYVDTTRDATLYRIPVSAHDSRLSLSGLFSYKLNWQTSFFLGYGDDRDRTLADTLARTDRQLFAKISYAFQH